MAVSLLALSVAIGGTGYAASQLPKDSVGAAQLKDGSVKSKEVKNGSLLAKDLKSGQLPTPARTYTKSFPTKSVQNGQFQFAALNLPAGSYVVLVRANAANAGPGVTRLECVLSPVGHPETQIDFFKTGLGAAADYPLGFDSLAMGGPVVLSAPGTVEATCGSQADTPVELITARMTAVRVDSVVVQ
jgi:hypothetical protein